jgi:hypothetical protein
LNPDSLGTLVLGIAVLVVAGISVVAVFRRKPSTEEMERKRRLYISRTGRMVDGSIVDVQGDVLFYSYDVRGVGYTASQDVGWARDTMPIDPHNLLGPITVKYSLQNPADSIVACEEWSGLGGKRKVKEETS